MNLAPLFAKLDELRRQRGFSKSELARQLGINRRTLYGYWKRTDMPAVMLFRMGDILGLDVDLVVTDDQKTKRPE